MLKIIRFTYCKQYARANCKNIKADVNNFLYSHFFFMKGQSGVFKSCNYIHSSSVHMWCVARFASIEEWNRFFFYLHSLTMTEVLAKSNKVNSKFKQHAALNLKLV